MLSQTNPHRRAISRLGPRTAHIGCLRIIALGGLDGNVAKQELDLIQFATGEMAQPGAVRRRSCGASFSIPARVAASRTISQSTLGVIPLPQTRPALLIDRKSAPSVIPLACFH